jgi:hypothetical protein
MRKSKVHIGICESCGEASATLGDWGRCLKCRTQDPQREKANVRARKGIWEAIRGECEACGNVALLGYGNWCDECNEIRDERCDIVERLRAVLASTAVVLSAREREILILRTRKTARRTARRCKIAVGAVAYLEQRALQAVAN